MKFLMKVLKGDIVDCVGSYSYVEARREGMKQLLIVSIDSFTWMRQKVYFLSML